MHQPKLDAEKWFHVILRTPLPLPKWNTKLFFFIFNLPPTHTKQTNNQTKPDVEVEFNTSKLGVRVNSRPDRLGLWVAAVTQDAPLEAQNRVKVNSHIISVNDKEVYNMPFEDAVKLFGSLTLPITVKFRPVLLDLVLSIFFFVCLFFFVDMCFFILFFSFEIAKRDFCKADTQNTQ